MTLTEFDRHTHKGRIICDKYELGFGYWGSVSLELHASQIRNPRSRVHSLLAEWHKAATTGYSPSDAQSLVRDLRSRIAELEANLCAAQENDKNNVRVHSERAEKAERQRDEALARIAELETANDEIKQQWAWDVDALRAEVERQHADFDSLAARQREMTDDRNAQRLRAETAERERDEAREAVARLGWECGCGHRNGIELATCACCGRRPGEKGGA